MWSEIARALVQYVKNGLFGKKLLTKYGVNNNTAKLLPAMKGHGSCDVITRIPPDVLQSLKNTSTSSIQGHIKAETDCQKWHSGAVAVTKNHKCITKVEAEKEDWRTDTFCGLERADQWQNCGRRIYKTRRGDDIP